MNVIHQGDVRCSYAVMGCSIIPKECCYCIPLTCSADSSAAVTGTDIGGDAIWLWPLAHASSSAAYGTGCVANFVGVGSESEP
jgi:hypothetical protein